MDNSFYSSVSDSDSFSFISFVDLLDISLMLFYSLSWINCDKSYFNSLLLLENFHSICIFKLGF